jgi:homoserine dehydrogenase
MIKNKIKIGIAGLGTVGKGVYDILLKDRELITKRTKTIIEVVAVSSKTKKDFIDAKIKYYQNPIDLADDPNVDIVIELIGGYDIAKELIFKSLKNHKKVITANKALIAEHGNEIAKFAKLHQGVILYEASVAGANPIIKSFREGFSANEINEIYAILNGTCNFILTKMTDLKQDYKITLKEAQELGYAEADPSFDVDGIDTAHKITILSCLATGSYPSFKSTFIQGISDITLQDVELANEFGYKIKLLAIFKNLGDKIQQTVYPALISNREKIAMVDGSYNAILTKGSNFEWNMMIGRGAGGLTTGSAVVADIIDIACNRYHHNIFNLDLDQLIEVKVQEISQRIGKYFIKFIISKNQANQKNFIEKIFNNCFNIEKIIYKNLDDDQVLCALISSEISESNLLSSLTNAKSNVESISFIRVEETKF